MIEETNAESKQSGKRVVSWPDYWRYLSQWLGLFIFAIISLIAIVGFRVQVVEHFKRGSNAYLGFTIISQLLAVIGVKLVVRLIRKQSDRMKAVEPVSRHNIDRIPASEVLVRGSGNASEPGDVLLRAAKSAEETPQQQLLRPME